MALTAVLCVAAMVAVARTMERPTAATRAPPPLAWRLAGRATAAVVAAGLVWGCGNAAVAVVLGFAPAYFVALGLTAHSAGMLVSLFPLAMVPAAPLGGMLVARLGYPVAIIAMTLVLTAVAILLMAVRVVPALMLLIAGAMLGAIAGAIVALPVAVVAPEDRAMAMGVFWLFFFLPMAALPPLVGRLRDMTGAPDTPILAAAGCFVLALAALGAYAALRPRGVRTGRRASGWCRGAFDHLRKLRQTGAMVRGRFITLEGGEGAGKSTQARRIAAALAAAGTPALITREPGGAPGAEKIRALLLGHGAWDTVAEAMLHFAARREHVVRIIRPALEAGIWVVCDRFADSTLAYQGAGQGLSRDLWRGLADMALEGLWPDLTLVLDVPVEAGMARAAGRSAADRYETLGLEFHRRVREAFLRIAAEDPARCAVLDAARDPDAVFADIAATLRARLGALP